MIVLDASVIIKWFQKEEGSERALVYEDKHARGEETVAIPDLLLYEITNVLRYQKSISEPVAKDILDLLSKMELQIFTFSPFELQEIFSFARKYDISVYDAIYIILAYHLGSSFITADKKLYQKLDKLAFISLL